MGSDDAHDREEGRESSRLHRLGRKLLDRGEDVRELATTLLESSDRAKSEMVRMIAREVRNYLDELRLKEDVLSLLRSHSLELKISMHLKPLAEAVESARGESARGESARDSARGDASRAASPAPDPVRSAAPAAHAAPPAPAVPADRAESNEEA
jgi:hypothetical protein